MKSSFIKNGAGDLHIIEQDGKETTLILMIPGMFGIAEHFSEEFQNFQDFPLVAMSLRGRGQSSKTFESFTFEDHVSDVLAFIDTSQASRIVLMAHSFGCLVATAAALARRDRVSGLILIDKGLSQRKITEQWLERVRTNPPETSSFEIALKIYNDSKVLDLKQEFAQSNIPAIFFKGEAEGHVLTEAEAIELSQIPQVRVVRLQNSGHSPSPSDYATFVNEAKRFLHSLE
jgi:pimeloyl-ACP methyl ester carboxylesterase